MVVNTFMEKEDEWIYARCHNLGHDSYHFLLLHKYDNTIVVVHYDFYRVNTHCTKGHYAFFMVVEHIEKNLFAIEFLGAKNTW